jgi:hypothetical protein
VTCRKEVGGCGGQWCWMCRGDWATHGEKTGGYFSCNLYDKSAAKKIDENAGSVVLEAQYFEHFSQRFMNHGQLEEDATKKKEECLLKWMPEYREESGGLDPTFLLDALELLVRCRHTLKYTYVFSWFQDQAIKNKGSAPQASGNDNNAKDKFNKDLQLRLKKIQKKVQAKAGAAAASRAENASGAVALLQARKELFDFQQASLEGVTESLGELLFSGRVVEKAGELKSLTRITRQYLNNLVSGFEDMREDDEDLE